MSSTSCRCWRMRIALCGALVLAFGAQVSADPKPLKKEEQAKVDKAIDRAIAFVKKSQKETGEFGSTDPRMLPANTLYGFTLFPALALLESGVPASDPVIEKVVKLVRNVGLKLNRTYDVSLAILFLDRLSDSKDDSLIRKLALRLIASQSYTGGWSYATRPLSDQNEKILWAVLRARHVKDDSQSKASDNKASIVRPWDRERLKPLAILQEPGRLSRSRRKALNIPFVRWSARDAQSLYTGVTDNSNTQFAILALWAASRHGVPVDRTLDLVVKRFQEGQNEDGTWCYRYELSSTSAKGDPRSNTAAALLGLAMAYRADKPAQERVDPAIKEQIIKGLAVLSREIGTPTGQMDRRVPATQLYFLWSVERLAALYNLPLIGEKDWYRWGAEIFVTNQSDSGAWNCGQERSYGSEPVCTSFGLLFLKRVNFTRDLTAKLPMTAKELNQGVARLLPKQGTLEKTITTPSRSKDPDR